MVYGCQMKPGYLDVATFYPPWQLIYINQMCNKQQHGPNDCHTYDD